MENSKESLTEEYVMNQPELSVEEMLELLANNQELFKKWEEKYLTSEYDDDNSEGAEEEEQDSN